MEFLQWVFQPHSGRIWYLGKLIRFMQAVIILSIMCLRSHAISYVTENQTPEVGTVQVMKRENQIPEMRQVMIFNWSVPLSLITACSSVISICYFQWGACLDLQVP